MNDIDNRAFSTAVLKNPMEELLDLISPQIKHTFLEDMKSKRLDMSDSSASYSLREIRNYFHSVFGDVMAQLLTDILRKELERLDSNDNNV